MEAKNGERPGSLSFPGGGGGVEGERRWRSIGGEHSV
jgi:hypothetical protein